MNKIIDVKVDMHLETHQKPDVHCLFDEIKTDHLVFDVAGSECSDEFKSRHLMTTMDISGFNLLAIDNDLAVWYFFSAVVPSSNIENNLKLRVDGEIIEKRFTGLWCNNAEAINFWFPKTLVMRIRGSRTREEFDSTLGVPMAAVADPVTHLLTAGGWKVGLVHGIDGYVDVEPLLPDGSPKSYKAKVIRPLGLTL